MVLDLELFRADKGGCPDKIKENQKKRCKDVKLVDCVIDCDDKWRKCKLIVINFEFWESYKLHNDIFWLILVFFGSLWFIMLWIIMVHHGSFHCFNFYISIAKESTFLDA